MNYDLDWGINLADYFVAMSPFAGPVGMYWVVWWA